jgi:hypothetical protein
MKLRLHTSPVDAQCLRYRQRKDILALMTPPDVRYELLSAEYPFFKSGHDPDIERYFQLRELGRPHDALRVYNTRLRPRYPDDEARTRILRAWRLKQPIYRTLVRQSLEVLADILLDRIKRTLRLLAVHASSYNPRDAYSTIKAAEAMLGFLPNDRFEAVAAIEKLHQYAQRLSYYKDELAKAESLVRAYLTGSLDVVAEERKRREAERNSAVQRTRQALVAASERLGAAPEAVDFIEASRQRRDRERSRARKALDLSGLQFSPSDLARIQIPPTLRRLEDKVLAFCFKYWNLAHDKAFERVLFLYTRKYGTRHYDVFSAIRTGRIAGRRDEEILAAVSACLISGYYYSIQGDRYMQTTWRRLKAKLGVPLAGTNASAPPQVEGLEVKVKPATTKKNKKTAMRKKPEAKKPAAELKKAASTAKKTVPAAKTTTLTVQQAESAKAARIPPRKKVVPQKAVAAKKPAVIVPRVYKPASQDEINAPLGLSISDKLRRLSGSSYDVYRDRFFDKLYSAIRSVLQQKREGRVSLFSSVPKEAEEAVYLFFKEHYDNPRADWQESSHRSELQKHGYDLDTLDPVIEECYRRL